MHNWCQEDCDLMSIFLHGKPLNRTAAVSSSTSRSGLRNGNAAAGRGRHSRGPFMGRLGYCRLVVFSQPEGGFSVRLLHESEFEMGLERGSGATVFDSTGHSAKFRE